MEDKQRYVFLKTIEKDGVVSALIADAKILGEDGISSLKMAFRASASPISRVGMLPMTLSQLAARIPELEKQGLDKSATAFERAAECIRQKSGIQLKPASRAPRSVAVSQSM